MLFDVALNLSLKEIQVKPVEAKVLPLLLVTVYIVSVLLKVQLVLSKTH